MIWRVGRQIPRNVYRRDVEVAVVVGEIGEATRIAMAIVATMNHAATKREGETCDDALCAYESAEDAYRRGRSHVIDLVDTFAAGLESKESADAVRTLAQALRMTRANA